SGRAIFADEDVYAGYKKRRHADQLVDEALRPLGVPGSVIKLLSIALAFDPKKRLTKVEDFAQDLASAEPGTEEQPKLPPAPQVAPQQPPQQPSPQPSPPPQQPPPPLEYPRAQPQQHHDFARQPPPPQPQRAQPQPHQQPTPPPQPHQPPMQYPRAQPQDMHGGSRAPAPVPQPEPPQPGAPPQPQAPAGPLKSWTPPPTVQPWMSTSQSTQGMPRGLPLSDQPTQVGDRRVHFQWTTNNVVDLGSGHSKVRVTFLSGPTGRVLHLKGLTCFVSHLGGRPSPAVQLDHASDIALVTPRAQEIGHIRVATGTPGLGQTVFPIGAELVGVSADDCMDPILFDFGPGSDAYFVYTRGRPPIPSAPRTRRG
ncbi:MAG TPA: hypothetical protein VGC42_01095, partial [Kofleriaceae bacterium]